MKRVLTLAAITSAALALTATSATAAGLPYGDTNPAHYSVVYVPEGFGACTSTNCNFYGPTQSGFKFTFDSASTGTVVKPCENRVVNYAIGRTGGVINSFTVASPGGATPTCMTPLFVGNQAVCAYSASGTFGGDLQFWLRADYGSVNPSFQPAFGRIQAVPGGVPPGLIIVDSIKFTNQVYGQNIPPQNATYTIDGVIDITNDMGFNTPRTGGTCTAFPEL